MQETTRRAVEELGSAIRTRRRELGMTQQQLAEMLGLNRDYLRHLERGEATQQLERLVSVMHQLGLDLRAVPRGGR